ncbi:MAG: DUF916 domain-containing protein [Micrococcales bacterium]|nr:DUF916 domain-containing protein [Micrococcales bacterium]
MKKEMAGRIVRNLFAATVISLVFTGSGMLASTSAQAEGETIGISIAPADKNGLDNRSRFSYQIEPGQTVSDFVRVSNPGSTPITVTVLAADAFNAEDGAFALIESKAQSTDAGSWVTFAGGETEVALELKPAEAQVIGFQLDVPADATPGDHAGGIVASASVVGEGEIAVERRVATRMYVRVAGELQPALTLSSFSATHTGGLLPTSGAVRVNAVLSNSGNVALSGTVTLTGSTWSGIAIGQTMEVELQEMLPGSSRTVTYDLAKVPQVGFVKPKLLLRSAVDGDAPDPGPLPVVERDAFVWAMPWLVLAILVIGGGGGTLLLRRRRRRDAEHVAAWIAQTQAEAGTETISTDPAGVATGSSAGREKVKAQ